MAVTAVQLARVSFNQRLFNLREALRLNQAGMYQVQNNLATGLRFLLPSEDPLGAAAVSRLDRYVERLDQVNANLRTVNAVLTDVESAAQEAVDLFAEARTLTLQAIGDTTTPEERKALVPVVDSILNQLITVGNRRHLNTYLFSGYQGAAPFELSHSGVLYRGDAGRRETIVEADGTVDAFTVSGAELFRALSTEIRGAVDLYPALAADTRISDLGGTTGRGVQLGRIVVTAAVERAEIDLSGAATVGDIIEKLNAELPGGLTATLEARGITLRQKLPGRGVSVTDVSGSRAAVDLGLSSRFTDVRHDGADIQPRVTELTRISDLKGRAGLDLSAGLVIRNGPRSATIKLDEAQTVEDVLNAINGADVGVWARIGSDGRTIEVLSRVSGASLYIEEAGGRAATELGIRSMHAGTALATLNEGRGVRTVAGSDLRVVTADGTTLEVDLDGATTLQDVVDRLNNARPGAITAALAKSGNGIVITDETAGGGTLRVEPANGSPAYRDLGLDVPAQADQVIGRDVNPLRADSPFTALLELRDGLVRDDRLAIQWAGERIERVLQNMQQVQGQMASQARMMGERTQRVEAETSATRVLLSDVRDVDYTDAIVRFQQLQTALQANLTTAAKVLNLSLLDYLR